ASKKDYHSKKPDGNKKDAPAKDNGKKVVDEQTSKLSGKATFAGKPLDLAYVTFVGESNRKFTTLVKDGNYAFRTAIPEGQYRIYLEPAGGEAVQAAIPQRYRAADTSGLTVRIEGKAFNFDISLQN